MSEGSSKASTDKLHMIMSEGSSKASTDKLHKIISNAEVLDHFEIQDIHGQVAKVNVYSPSFPTARNRGE